MKLYARMTRQRILIVTSILMFISSIISFVLVGIGATYHALQAISMIDALLIVVFLSWASVLR